MTITPEAALEPVELDETTEPEQIPEGWVRDRDTGEYRPPKRRGRKPVTPPPSEHDPIERTEDNPPGKTPRARKTSSASIPRYKAGVIAKGMATLYRRTGKILKALDRDIGIAVIESADDCGEAWDDLARTNPRIRAVCMKLITGGAWTQLFVAHLPILLAILMKDAIRKHIPFGKFLARAMEPDEDQTSAVSDMLGADLTPEDVQAMAATLMNGPMASMLAGMMRPPVEETGDDT